MPCRVPSRSRPLPCAAQRHLPHQRRSGDSSQKREACAENLITPAPAARGVDLLSPALDSPPHLRLRARPTPLPFPLIEFSHLLPFLRPISAPSFFQSRRRGRAVSPFLSAAPSFLPPSSGLGFAAGNSGGFVIRPRAAAAVAERPCLFPSAQRVLRASARSITPACLSATPDHASRSRGSVAVVVSVDGGVRSVVSTKSRPAFFFRDGSRRVLIESLISLPGQSLRGLPACS